MYIQAFPGVMRQYKRHIQSQREGPPANNKGDRCEKSILSRKIEWQLARYVAKNPRTTLKTLANDLTKSGI